MYTYYDKLFDRNFIFTDHTNEEYAKDIRIEFYARNCSKILTCY